MDIARRKFSSPQWWMCVWQHYTANMQRHVKEDDKKKDSQPTSKMIHPTCTSPPAAAERPKVLALTQPDASGPSLATLGSATVLDLSNPAVLNSLTADVVFTPNTEQMLLTTLTEAVSSQGLTAVSPTITTTTATAATSVPLMVAVEEEEAPVPSPHSDGGSDYSGSVSMDSMDPVVARAVQQSSDTGSLTPLIKTELKCTIQKKRIAAGKIEIAPEELLANKNKREELTPEEEERRNRRRERNKLAAQKCRSKRKERAQQLEEEVEELENSNANMREVVQQLEAEKEKLKRLLNFHDDQDSKCPKRQRLSEDHEEPEEELLEVLMNGETFMEDMQVVIN